MRVLVFIFSFLFLVQLNAAAFCSVYCEVTQLPPCHQKIENNRGITNTVSARSCCDGASACNIFDEQSGLYIIEKSHTQKKVDLLQTNLHEIIKQKPTFYGPTFIVTHYSIHGPPLYLLYSQFKIPNAA